VQVIDRRDSGREFQMVGPETQNALSPNLVLVLGTMKSVVSAEHIHIHIHLHIKFKQELKIVRVNSVKHTRV